MMIDSLDKNNQLEIEIKYTLADIFFYSII